MAISRSDMERQLRKMGGRIGFQEGGIMPRLNQLSGSVSSAEQMLQQINQRLQSAESSLGSGGGEQLQAVQSGSNNLFAGRPVLELQGQPRPISRGGPGPDQLNVTSPQTPVAMQTPLQSALGLADGGIASLQEPRQGYFLGKIVKKAKRAVKKVVKSPLGKAAILAAPFLMSGAGAGGIGSFFGKGSFNPLKALITKGPQTGMFGTSGLGRLLGKFGLAEGTKLTGLGKIAGITGLSGLAGLMAARGQQEEDDEEDFYRGEGLDIDRIVRLARQNDPQFRFLPPAEFTGAYAEGGTPVSDDDLEKMVRDFNKQADMTGNPLMTLEELKKILGKDIKKARKYKVGKAEGGIMNLGGMEMDLRGGGFVPLGAKEKADDVPARLSKNEFVMTADAVRAAGGGSVDKGADKMYKMMKDLEAQV